MRNHFGMFGLVVGCMLVIAACASPAFASNGERIYFTGDSVNGPIRYSGGDFGDVMGRGMMGRGMMRGVTLACADCHGSDARGGRHVMHMQVMNAPDIRWRTLTASEAGDDHTMEHAPYTPDTFAQAVRDGLDPAGRPLDAAMPRWQMADQDIADLIEFLKTR